MPDDEAAARVRATFGAAAGDYDSEAQSFFPRFGEQTVARLALPTGARVLDVACGTGNSALAAARVVGPNGSVLGVDLTEAMLERARAKAAAERLDNVDFVVADMREIDFPDFSFDAVVSVFGIFFVPDMTALVACLWRLVAPGGCLAITTWGPDLFEPLWSTYWEAVQAERPELQPAGAGWSRVERPEGLRELFAEAGVDGAVEVEPLAATHPLRSGDGWWDIVRGSGMRGVADALAPAERDRVRAACDAVVEQGAASIPVNVVFGVATRGRTSVEVA